MNLYPYSEITNTNIWEKNHIKDALITSKGQATLRGYP